MKHISMTGYTSEVVDDLQYYGAENNDEYMMYALVGDIDFGTQNWQIQKFNKMVPYYQEGKGFYWASAICHTAEQCKEVAKHQIHFSFLPQYRNYVLGNFSSDPYQGAICPTNVRIFFIMTRCQKIHKKIAKLCDLSELSDTDVIPLRDIDGNQSGMVNDAIYHQIYCVPKRLYPIPIQQKPVVE